MHRGPLHYQFAMKQKLISALLSVTLCLSALGSPTPRKSSWDDLQNYISAHATYVSPTAEAELFADVSMGVESWHTLGGSSARKARDQGGVGWGITGSVIVVPSLTEEAELAELIRLATYGG